MRRAITHAALTFSLFMSSTGLAQSAGGSSTGGTVSGGTPGVVQPQGAYEPGNFSPPPQLAPGDSGRNSMDTIETNTGAEPVTAPPAGATRGYILEPGIGGSGQPWNATGGTWGAGMNVPSTGTSGTGGSDLSGTGGAGTSGESTNTTGATSGGSSMATGSGDSGTATGGSGMTTGSAAGSNTMGTQPPATSQGSATGGGETPAGAATGSAVSDGAPETQVASGARPENLEQEVARLRDQVQRLEAEVDTLRREDTGTGGSGTQTPASDANVGSTVLASVVMQGQVASVGKDRVVVRDAESGATFNLFVTNTTHISANGKRVSPQQLSEGTPVQAAFNYIADGDTYATQIQAYPGRGR